MTAIDIKLAAGNVMTTIHDFLIRFDNTLFKIGIDYILRNFDPTGINIAGLVNSAWVIIVLPFFESASKILAIKVFPGK